MDKGEEEPLLCGQCGKPQGESDEELPQLWSPKERRYISTCAPCYARAVSGYRKRLISKKVGG